VGDGGFGPGKSLSAVGGGGGPARTSTETGSPSQRDSAASRRVDERVQDHVASADLVAIRCGVGPRRTTTSPGLDDPRRHEDPEPADSSASPTKRRDMPPDQWSAPSEVDHDLTPRRRIRRKVVGGVALAEEVVPCVTDRRSRALRSPRCRHFDRRKSLASSITFQGPLSTSPPAQPCPCRLAMACPGIAVAVHRHEPAVIAGAARVEICCPTIPRGALAPEPATTAHAISGDSESPLSSDERLQDRPASPVSASARLVSRCSGPVPARSAVASVTSHMEARQPPQMTCAGQSVSRLGDDAT